MPTLTSQILAEREQLRRYGRDSAAIGEQPCEAAENPRPWRAGGHSVMMPLRIAGFLGVMVAVAAWAVADVAGSLARSSFASGDTVGHSERRIRNDHVGNARVLAQSLQRQPAKNRAGGPDEIAQIVAARRDEIFNDPETPVGERVNSVWRIAQKQRAGAS